ncbi:MAG: leucine-rich repeat domain-containing protein, partial [Candidatus Izemoplasmatales bacterium]|nr:leucine-rich repeat domain-containing protein [Candidatus Izemoplasmatales bacterium]
AFLGASSLTKIVIPNSVTSIGEAAFSGASSLKSIVIPNSVMSIGSYAFSGATSLESVVIQNGVRIISTHVFSGASNLKSIVIPNSVTSIGEAAFSGTSNLSSITLPFIGNSRISTGSNASFGYIFGLSSYTGSYQANGYYLPIGLQEVTVSDASSIGSLAFLGASSLTKIVIPNGVRSIGNSAFSGASSLMSIIIPDSVTSIGEAAFSGTSNLSSITLPFIGNSRTSTGKNASFGYIFGTTSYSGSYNANGYYLPIGLQEVAVSDASRIGPLAFLGASSLTKIVIPNSVTSIGEAAFSGASSLKSIVIPNSVTSIGEAAFSGTSNLSSITLPFVGNSRISTSTNASFGYIFGTTSYSGSYNANGYYLPVGLNEVIINDSVTNESYLSFGSSTIRIIVIPNCLTMSKVLCR